jgi:hypothetical protein
VSELSIGSFQLSLAAVLVFGLLAATSALAVHKTAAVYHDGLRTSVPELWMNQRPRVDLAKYSYAIGIGFVLAYALPYSLATGIMVIHIILLSSDVLGLWFQRTWTVLAASFAFGAVATVVIAAAAFGMQHLPDYEGALQAMFAPVAATFPFLVAVAIAHQFGVRWGAAAAVLTLAAWRLLETALTGSDHSLSAKSGALTLGLMTLGLVASAFTGPRNPPVGDQLYAEGVKRVHRHWPYLVLPPVLITVAASQGWLAGEPLQLVLLAVGSHEAAAAVAFYSVVAFIPLIAMSSTVSGVWNQDGYPDWYLGAGYLVREPVGAVAAGLALVAVELGSLRRVMHLLMTRPRLHGIGSAARDALDVVPGVSILAGAVVAASGLGGVIGAGIVVVLYAFNEAKGRPIMPMAVPVFGFLSVALTSDALQTLGLG